jgi:hypothetical protein
MGGRCLGTRSDAASSRKRVGAGAFGVSRMGGRALGACSGRWPRRGLGAGALGGIGLGCRALKGGPEGKVWVPGHRGRGGWIPGHWR